MLVLEPLNSTIVGHNARPVPDLFPLLGQETAAAWIMAVASTSHIHVARADWSRSVSIGNKPRSIVLSPQW